MQMIENLEGMINGKQQPDFKSEGERKIAYFLEENSIKYRYESGVLVNSYKDKLRIWYPDFYLPEFKTHIEYYGLAGNQNYDKGIKTKETMYSKIGLDVISVYPWMLKKNWQGHIMKELERSTIRSYKNLMAKPYWSKNSSTLNNHVTPARGGYRRGGTKHY